jgi:hypothetical protein
VAAAFDRSRVLNAPKGFLYGFRDVPTGVHNPIPQAEPSLGGPLVKPTSSVERVPYDPSAEGSGTGASYGTSRTQFGRSWSAKADA